MDLTGNTSLTLLKRLEARAQAVDSLLCVGLDPHPDMLPAFTAQAAQDLCLRLVDATHDLACAFKPNSAFFEMFGGAGFEALRAVTAHIRAVDSSIPIILDGKRGDIASTAEAYARAAFEHFDADAITLNPYMGRDAIEPFLKRPSRGAFMLCRTSNPGAADFQELQTDVGTQSMRLYQAVAARAREWNTGENLGLVVGALDERALTLLRAEVPDTWFLVPGIGAQGGELDVAVNRARRADGLGFLITVSRAIARADDPRDEAQGTRDDINRLRQRFAAAGMLARRPIAAAPTTPRGALAWALYAADCVQFGEFTLKSGVESPIYLDLRRLVSVPASMGEVAGALASYIRERALDLDHLAAIPYAALPIAAVAAMQARCSLVYPRREVKDYGTKAAVEGVFEAGDTVVLIDDLATTGESKFEAIQRLQEVGLRVRDIVVVIDREQGARETLEDAGYHFHALMTLTQLLDELEQLGKLDPEQRREIDAWRRTQQP
jgi:uridine monophosphate synthetase